VLIFNNAHKSFTIVLVLSLFWREKRQEREYSLVSEWVEVKDWVALEDVVPGMERALWFLTIVSILLKK